jgi:hypothetical protein
MNFRSLAFVVATIGVCAATYSANRPLPELRDRIPEAAPYVTAEAQFFPPPFEEYWKGVAHPGQCQSCHQRIFAEWSGSMMANAWRDPVWRGAFLLSARQTSTSGDCEVPDPPDGTPKARHNPFAPSRLVQHDLRWRRWPAGSVTSRFPARRLLFPLPYAQQLYRQRTAARCRG